MALAIVPSAAGIIPNYESKLVQNSITLVTIPTQTVTCASETKSAGTTTNYSFPAKELKLPRGNSVPQIMVIDGMRKVFTTAPPSPTDETFIKAQKLWQAKLVTTKMHPYADKLSFIAARYFCSPKSKESGFEVCANEAKDDPNIWLFSQADWLRICLEVKKMDKAGATKQLSQFGPSIYISKKTFKSLLA